MDFKKETIDTLKTYCENLGLKKSYKKKEDLIIRLNDFLKENPTANYMKESPEKKSSEKKNDESLEKKDLDEKKNDESLEKKDLDEEIIKKSTIPELKKLCEKHGLKSTCKKKEELCDRLKQFLLDGKIEEKEPKRKVKETSEYNSSAKVFKYIQNDDKIVINKNKFGNYEHDETKLVFNKITKEVMGYQLENGEIRDIDVDDIELCKKYKFAYILPKNLVLKNIDDLKIEEEEDSSEEEFEEIEESEDEEEFEEN